MDAFLLGKLVQQLRQLFSFDKLEQLTCNCQRA